MTFSIFFLSFALGPLVFGPLSEIYGRKWILHASNFVNIVINMGCAFTPTTGSFLAFRFLAGWAAAPPVVIGGGIVDDMFCEQERAAAMSIFFAMPVFSSVVGPIAGASITQHIGIKYLFLIMGGLCGVASLIGIPCLNETYPPVIRLNQAKRASGTDNVTWTHSHANEPTWHILWVNLSRPVRLLFGSFICFILSLYLAMVYGINLLIIATFAKLFTDIYHFSTVGRGLVFIGLGIGYSAAVIFGAHTSSKIYSTLSERNNGKGTPEMRIPALIIGSFSIPIGLLWYGWSAEKEIHWIMPIIGAGIFAFGQLTALLTVNLYLVDAFAYAASALAAAGVFQSLLCFVFPLFGQDLYTKMGYGGGNSLLAGLAIVIGIPFPIWIWYKGESIRKRSAAHLAAEVGT